MVLAAPLVCALGGFGGWIRGGQFQGARGRAQRRARDGKETAAMGQIPHRPNRAGLELSASLQSSEIELEVLFDGLADQRLAVGAAQLQQCTFVERQNI